MTDPVKQLINNIEDSISKNDYNEIRITTNTHTITVTPIDISYCSRYFFKVSAEGSETIININNLEIVELY